MQIKMDEKQHQKQLQQHFLHQTFSKFGYNNDNQLTGVEEAAALRCVVLMENFQVVLQQESDTFPQIMVLLVHQVEKN